MAKIKNLIKAVVFCAIFLVIFVHISYILRPYAGSASRKNITGFYAEEKNSLDVAFVGSSSVFSFWEPMRFWNEYGVTSYDYATGTLPVQMIRYEIAEVLKYQDPSLFVIDLRPFTIAETGYYKEKDVPNMDHDVPIRNSVDNMKYSLNRVKAIMEGVPDDYDKIPYFIDLIKYHTEWDRLKDAESLSYWRNETKDVARGFKLVDDVKPQKFTDWSADEERLAVTPRVEEVMRDLIDYCKQEDLEVLFLVNMYCQSQSEKEIYNYLTDIIEENGYPVINANDHYEEIGVDFSTDYYDKSHTNIFGADKYTDFIGSYIMEHYSFEDHREDSAYAQWNEDFEAWTEETDELKASITAKIEKLKADQ